MTEFWRMLNRIWERYGPGLHSSLRCGLPLTAGLIILVLVFQSACFGKKSKVETIPVSEVPIAILPFNIPLGNQELRWTAMAGIILMAKASANAEDLNVTPLWQTMPIALEAAGQARSFSPESAAYVASWLGVKWSAMGGFSPAKSRTSMMIDFIPAKSSSIAFRFTKSGDLDELGLRMPEAFTQFARYLALRPLAPTSKKLPTLASMKNLAEALDREYGWFVEADPGKAQKVVEDLLQTDDALARFLFNPALYPALTPAK